MEAGSSPDPVAARPEDETDLLAQLRYFEARVDKEDPEQNAMLEQIREHVRRLRHGRGEWSRPTTDRTWNDPMLPLSAKAPMAIDSYRQAGWAHGRVMMTFMV